MKLYFVQIPVCFDSFSDTRDFIMMVANFDGRFSYPKTVVIGWRSDEFNECALAPRECRYQVFINNYRRSRCANAVRANRCACRTAASALSRKTAPTPEASASAWPRFYAAPRTRICCPKKRPRLTMFVPIRTSSCSCFVDLIPLSVLLERS